MNYWNWSRAENNENEAELTLYGEIVSEKWWDTDVSLTDFYKAMREKASDAERITVRINSPGGEVNAAMGIYNLLKTCGKSVSVVIDGFAASAATLVAMAGDEIKIPKSAIFMIHDPTAFGRGTAAEHRKCADNLEKYKSCIIAAYAGKTGKSEEELSEMMSRESYMTGEEAVREGFCTLLTDDETEVTVSNEGIVYVNSAKAGKIPMMQYTKNVETKKKERNDGEMEIKTKDDLMKAYPEIAAEIAKDAAKAERERIRDIEDMTPPGFEAMAIKAKFDDAESPVDYMKKVVAAQKEQGAKFLKERANEIKNSGADNVGNEPPADDGKKDVFDAALDDIENDLKGGEM